MLFMMYATPKRCACDSGMMGMHVTRTRLYKVWSRENCYGFRFDNDLRGISEGNEGKSISVAVEKRRGAAAPVKKIMKGLAPLKLLSIAAII